MYIISYNYYTGDGSTSEVEVLSRNVIIACAVSLTIFVIIVFVIGYVFGCASYRYLLSIKSLRKTNSDRTMAIYSKVELAMPRARDIQQQQNPEMVENVAYRSVNVR